MKISLYSVATAALATTLFLSAPTFAQTGANNTGAGGGDQTTQTQEPRNDDDTDWGWLGLLGLAGLAGLLKRPERQVVHQNDTRTGTPNR